MVERQLKDPIKQNHRRVKDEALVLYNIINDKPGSEEEAQKFILDVFKFYNSQLVEPECCLKKYIANLANSHRTGSLTKPSVSEEEPVCQHSYDEDQSHGQCFQLQWWFLNFSKFLTLMILTQDQNA